MPMKNFRRVVVKYERGFMLGLVIVLLAIFTVTSDIVDFLGPGRGGGHRGHEIAGSFSVLPGERREVTWDDYDQARVRYAGMKRGLTRAMSVDVSDTEVWTHMALLEAARREGISASDADIRSILDRLFPDEIIRDKAKYRDFVQQMTGLGIRDFEEGLRDQLSVARLREVHADSYNFAPPVSREQLFQNYRGRGIEFTRSTWAALDAKDRLEAAKKGLADNPEAEKTLREFFETDAAVKAETLKFQHPKRFKFEVLYVLYKNIGSDDGLQRILGLFGKTWPNLDLNRLKPSAKEIDDYFRISGMRERLLATKGMKITDVKVGEPSKETVPPGPGEPAKDGEKPPGEGEKPPAEPLVDPALEKARDEKARDLVQDQIIREIQLRGMMQFMRDEAGKDEKKSLRSLYDQLKANDDPGSPVCATEAGKGLIVYREFLDGLSVDEMKDLEDSGIKFSFNFSLRITSTPDKDLPRVGQKSDLLGPEGDGRMIWRVLELVRERRKTFAELSQAEKEALRDEFYLPERARQISRQEMEEFRKPFAEGASKPADFAAAARARGYRVIEGEEIVSADRNVADPDPKRYWPAEFLRMRDRKFLRSWLWSVLQRDARDKKLQAGSFPDVAMDSRRSAEDPGTAICLLLLERREPTAADLPPQDLQADIDTLRRQRGARDGDWWVQDPERVFQRFGMEFSEDMQKRIQSELNRRRSGGTN